MPNIQKHTQYYQLREPNTIRTHQWKIEPLTANHGRSIVERQATSVRQAETELKPVPKKEPSTHTCTPKMTNQVNERQPREVEDRPKHITPRTTLRKTSQERESQAQGTQRPSTQWKKEVRKTEIGPQAHNDRQPKGTKAQEARDRPKAHDAEQPSNTEAKRGNRDRPKAHNV